MQIGNVRRDKVVIFRSKDKQLIIVKNLERGKQVDDVTKEEHKDKIRIVKSTKQREKQRIYWSAS